MPKFSFKDCSQCPNIRTSIGKPICVSVNNFVNDSMKPLENCPYDKTIKERVYDLFNKFFNN